MNHLQTDSKKLIADEKPPPHNTYLVYRGGRAWTAKPLYGMHEPAWVPQSPDRELPPVLMIDTDEWLEL